MMTPVPQGGLTVARMCALARVSRAGYYRSFKASAPRQEETCVRDAIQRIALKNRFYGYRRILVELRKEGFDINHKRVLRLMRRDNLLCLRKRPFVPITTQSQHSWPVVPNLARSMVPTGPNQLWVADITYVRMLEEFAYLAIVLDAFSRRVIGWALDDHLNTSLAIAGLKMALDTRRPKPGSLVHHSDRGVQYASGDYTLLLEAHGIVASMSRLGNPYDNAKAESFMKTLKHENYGDTLLISNVQRQLIVRRRERLASRLAPLQRTPERLLDLRHEIVGAKRPAAGFRGAQRGEGGAVSFGLEPLPDVPDAINERCHPHEAVIAASEMRTRARPCPVLRARDEFRAHRVERHIARGDDEVRVIHDHRAKPALEQMPGPARAGIDEAGVAAVGLTERAQARPAFFISPGCAGRHFPRRLGGRHRFNRRVWRAHLERRITPSANPPYKLRPTGEKILG
jgi:putative transposase